MLALSRVGLQFGGKIYSVPSCKSFSLQITLSFFIKLSTIHSAVVLNISSPNNFIDATLDNSLWMPISVAFLFRYCTRKNESLSIYRPVIKLGSSVSAQRSICIASSEEFDHCLFICRRVFSSSSGAIPNFNCPIPICGIIIISFITKPYTKKVNHTNAAVAHIIRTSSIVLASFFSMETF